MEFFNDVKNFEDLIIIEKFDKITYYNKMGLLYIGMWPLESNASKLRILLRRIHLFIIFFLVFFLISVQWFDMYCLWGNLDANTETILSNAFVSTAIIKFYKFMNCIHIFKDIFITMRKNWISVMKNQNSKKNKEIMYNLTIKGSQHSTIYFMSIFSTVFTYFIMPAIQYKSDDIRERRYPFFGRYYFDRNSDLIYGLCYTIQVITGIAITTMTYALDSIFVVCIYHSCAQIRILQNDLKNLGKDKFISKETLKGFIRRHQIEIENIYLLDVIFSSLSLQQLLMSCIMMCVTVFQLIITVNDRSPEFFMYLVCIPLVFIQLLFYCYPGNELIVQSKLISDTIYQSSWTNLKTPLKKNLIFMIQRSQIPLSITAGKIYVLSLEILMKILKTSMSALSVLYAMYNK